MIKTLPQIMLGVLMFYLSISNTWAAIQLDDNFRPDNLPAINAEEAVNEANPETAATQTLIMFVGKLISQVLLFTGALTIFFLILAGSNYITALGKDESIEKGKRGIFWSVMGLIVILLSYAIVQGILQIVLQVDESAI